VISTAYSRRARLTTAATTTATTAAALHTQALALLGHAMYLAGSWLQRVLRACEHDARCRTTEALLCIGQIAPRGMDLEDLLEEVVNAVYYFTDAHRVNLFMVDEICDELWCAKSRGIDGVTLPLGQGLCGTAAATGCIVNVADCYADERFDPLYDLATAYHTRSMLCMPVPPPEPGHDLVCTTTPSCIITAYT
jgi:GAF domain-containing protein